MRILPRLKRGLPCGPRFFARACPALLAFLACGGATAVSAQRLAWQDEAKPFRRHVSAPALESGAPNVVTADFYAHGQLTGEDPPVTAYARAQPVPVRVLQVGPGDYCRVALQPRQGETDYQVYYGGTKSRRAAPEWSFTGGLLLETRRWKDCRLDQLQPVRQAYEASSRIGSDYVSQVFHRHNPFDVAPAPFLSHYTGALRISVPGLYQFFTSSQDCSFLLIDEQAVVSAPGRHHPTGQARFKGEIQLDVGDHRFDYWHAAAGSDTCAVAAWQVPGAAHPEVIPAKAFGGDRVAQVAALQPEHVNDGPIPDFRFAIRGEAPIEDGDPWVIRVEYQAAVPASDRGGACRWDFGDGQTDTQWQGTHVYLLPGPYTVRLQVRRRGKTVEVANRVAVTRFLPGAGEQNADQVDDYLPILDRYDLAALDAPSLLQLVRLRLQREEWEKAIDLGMRALTASGAASADVSWQVAATLDPVARFRLGDSEAALRLWQAAGQAITDGRQRALCALAAADIALNELLETAEAGKLLETADAQCRDGGDVHAADLHRLWGDWHARRGDAAAALAAYQLAARTGSSGLNVAQQNARRGAYSRSAEAFLRDGDLPRAAEQLNQWQRDFPQDKPEGYLSTLLARYWLARKRPAVALAVVGDLLTVVPQSPYADRLVLLRAEAEEALGHTDRAIAACETLLADYPGSPLRDAAQEKIAALQAAAAQRPGRGGKTDDAPRRRKTQPADKDGGG